jgi:hypothetical protein
VLKTAQTDTQTLLDVAACGVSGNFVCIQVRSIWNLICALIIWSSIVFEVDFPCRKKFADISL